MNSKIKYLDNDLNKTELQRMGNRFVGYVKNGSGNVYYNYIGPELVDLGLPSRTLWHSCNIGAYHPWEQGLFFQWGDIKGYGRTQVNVNKTFDWSDYKYGTTGGVTSKYNSSDLLTELEGMDDIGHIEYGDKFCIASAENYNELIDNTTITVDMNYKNTGVGGFVFKSTNNSNEIFFPIALPCDNKDIKLSVGQYWSKSLNYDSLGVSSTANAVILSFRVAPFLQMPALALDERPTGHPVRCVSVRPRVVPPQT